MAATKMSGHQSRTCACGTLNHFPACLGGLHRIFAKYAIPVRSDNLHGMMQNISGEQCHVVSRLDLYKHVARCVPRSGEHANARKNFVAVLNQFGPARLQYRLDTVFEHVRIDEPAIH